MTTDEIIEIPPEPKSPGIRLEQEKSKQELTPSQSEGIARGSLEQYPLTTVVQAITDLGIKGASAMALLFASTKRLETDLFEERAANKKAVEEINIWKDKFYLEKETNAVLREKVSGAIKLKTLQNVFITLGGILAGVGARNVSTEFSGISLTILLFGLCLLLTGWFWPNILSKDTKK